jgi:hypothetical protein
MAVLTRVTDFIPNTLIKSQEVDDEFNQLVNLLSGGSTNKDTLLKFSDATNPVLRVDQLGAGVIQQWLQNGAVKTVIDNSGFLYIGEGVTDATPANGLINGTGGSGSNIAGGNLNLAGGKGTGNATPGAVAIRYPLIGASGSTLQSLTTEDFPVSTNVFTVTGAGNQITNTTTETSYFTGSTLAAGSTRTLQGGSTRLGSAYRLLFNADLSSTASPNFTIRVKLGSVVIWSSGVIALPATTAAIYLDIFFTVNALGASGGIRADGIGTITSVFVGLGTFTHFVGSTNSVVDTTVNETLDVTGQFGTASASNNTQMFQNTILQRLR